MESRIGWVGLGNMGTPMVKRLVNAGLAVTVYNRTISKAQALQKEVRIDIAERPADLVSSCDFIITMVADDAALKTVHFDPGGIQDGQPSRSVIVIDMSTVSPHTSLELSARAAKKGIHYLDAPVSGSVRQAMEGQLVFMVGGSPEDYEKANPIFSQLGKASHLIGPAGSGNYTKLAVNLFLGITAQGLSEAVLFAEKNNIPPGMVLTIINNGVLGSAFTKLKANNIVENDFQPAFALKHQEKDLRIAKAEGMNSPAGNAVFQSYQQARQKGFGEEDMIAILKYLKQTIQ